MLVFVPALAPVLVAAAASALVPAASPTLVPTAARAPTPVASPLLLMSKSTSIFSGRSAAAARSVTMPTSRSSAASPSSAVGTGGPKIAASVIVTLSPPRTPPSDNASENTELTYAGESGGGG